MILVWVRASGHGNTSHLQGLGVTRVRPRALVHWMAHGVVILECPRTPQLEVWARSYGVLSGAMSRDNAQLCECCGEGHHNPGSDARESISLGGA